MAHAALDAFDYALIEALPALRTHARALTRSGADADDLAQDAVLAALRHRDAFVVGTNMTAWLKLIARNRFFDTSRNERRRGMTFATGRGWCDDPEKDDEWFPEIVAGSLPAAQHDRLEAAEALHAVGQLSPKLREAMGDIIAGKDVDEAARERQMPAATVRTRRCRARDAMRVQFGMPKLMAAR